MIPPSKPFTIVKERELWATQQQYGWSGEYLQWYGEQCVLRLLWRWTDHEAGLVDICQNCQDTPAPQLPNADIRRRVSSVYKQSGNVWCNQCYGTTFVGGFKPVLYHIFMAAEDTPEVRRRLDTGNFWQENPQVQFSAHPEIRTGDLIIRITDWDARNQVPLQAGTRYTAGATRPQTLRTGPGSSLDPIIRTGQSCTLKMLPTDHPLQNVPWDNSRGVTGLP